MKCKDCNADDNLLRKLPARRASWMEELFTENMTVPSRGYFVTKDGKMVSLYVCPNCGKVQGELAADKRLREIIEL